VNIVEIYRRFPTANDCISHLERVRWQDKPICPYCKSDRTTPMKSVQRHYCNSCNTTFSVTDGTIFDRTRLDLQKWFLAITFVLKAKKGLSTRQLARDIEVNRNTAWHMGMRIRNAMIEQPELMHGIITTRDVIEVQLEADHPKPESLIGAFTRDAGTDRQQIASHVGSVDFDC
jgi:transposase-like protein